MDFERFFADKLAGLKAEGRYRTFAEIEPRAGRFPRAAHHGLAGAPEVVVWCSNDYLGMGQHPAVIEAMTRTIAACGAGAGGTRNISGTSHALVALLHAIARFKMRVAAEAATLSRSAARLGASLSGAHLDEELVDLGAEEFGLL